MSYIYTFIRDDITAAQKIIQLGHACHEAGKVLPHAEHRDVSTMVLLAAQDEDDLKDISCILDCAGIDHHMFFEPDNGMGYSAICTRPVTSQRERALFRQWNLYKHAV